MEMRELLTKSLLEAKLRQAQDLDDSWKLTDKAQAEIIRKGAQKEIDKQVEALLKQ